MSIDLLCQKTEEGVPRTGWEVTEKGQKKGWARSPSIVLNLTDKLTMLIEERFSQLSSSKAYQRCNNESERGEWKSWLKTQHWKTMIMASGPITSWQTDNKKVETVTDFIFLGSKITVDGDCSHKIKRHLLLGRKAMTNLDGILKSRDIT